MIERSDLFPLELYGAIKNQQDNDFKLKSAKLLRFMKPILKRPPKETRLIGLNVFVKYFRDVFTNKDLSDDEKTQKLMDLEGKSYRGAIRCVKSFNEMKKRSEHFIALSLLYIAYKAEKVSPETIREAMFLLETSV